MLLVRVRPVIPLIESFPALETKATVPTAGPPLPDETTMRTSKLAPVIVNLTKSRRQHTRDAVRHDTNGGHAHATYHPSCLLNTELATEAYETSNVQSQPTGRQTFRISRHRQLDGIGRVAIHVDGLRNSRGRIIKLNDQIPA